MVNNNRLVRLSTLVDRMRQKNKILYYRVLCAIKPFEIFFTVNMYLYVLTYDI